MLNGANNFPDGGDLSTGADDYSSALFLFENFKRILYTQWDIGGVAERLKAASC